MNKIALGTAIAYDDVFKELNYFLNDLVTKVNKNLQKLYSTSKNGVTTVATGTISSINDIKTKSVQEILKLLNEIINQVKQIGEDTFYIVKSMVTETLEKSGSITDELLNTGGNATRKISEVANITIRDISAASRDISRKAREVMMRQFDKYKIIMDQKLAEVNSDTYTISTGTWIYWVLLIIVVIWILALIIYALYRKKTVLTNK